MIKKWLERAAASIFLLFALVIAAAGALQWQRPASIEVKEPEARKFTLPKGSFVQDPDAYSRIGEPILALNYRPPRMQLPDLRQKLSYYGQNGRPDASKENSLMHFGIGSATASIPPGEPLYLLYDKSEGSDGYRFSPGNKETSLWIEALAEEKEASLIVRMIDEKGEVVATPSCNESFDLKEKELQRQGSGKAWEIGKWRVDGTLLARQKARWYGVDKFLEEHGGEEYEAIAGKNRIDIMEGETPYSLYVGEGSALIWDGAKWKSVTPGEESRGQPLLVVKKVDERLMNLELWDIEGKKKVSLNLLKSMESWVPENLQQEFKFMGARTRSQFVFEVADEKMLLSPSDWLLRTEEGWKKLSTIEEIDNYVELREKGALFIFEGIARVGDQQLLKGEMYNPSRTQQHMIDLPVQKDGLVYQASDKEKKRLPLPPGSKAPISYANGQALDNKMKAKNLQDKSKLKRPH